MMTTDISSTLRPRDLSLALLPLGPVSVDDARALAALVLPSSRVELKPFELGSYAALFEAVDRGACAAAWAPPVVALDLVRCGVARPLVAAERRGGLTYYSVLVVPDDSRARGLGDLAGRHVGWIARESAAGYVVPRLHLRALGLDPSSYFARESFLGTHDAVFDALDQREVDVAATYAAVDPSTRSLVLPRALSGFRILAAAGPIPTDVILVRSSVPGVVADAVARALSSLDVDQHGDLLGRLRLRRFVPVTGLHLEPLRRLRARASSEALRALLP